MLSFGMTNIPEDAPAGANAKALAKPPTGEETGRQVNYGERLYWTGDAFTPNGGACNNPCGFPGYGTLYAGSPATYRLIRRHPRVAHARAQVMNPVIANPWGWETREATPDAWVDLVRDMLEPQILDIKSHKVRGGLDYGHAGSEKVWEVREGRYWLAKAAKPLSVDTTHILVDKTTGDFAGLRYGSGDEWLDRRKCWLWTYDGEAGELYGHSRLENIRETAWRDWLDCATQLYKLAEKASGIIPVVKTPAGTFKDSTGASVTWKSNAETAINALRNARGVWFPTLAVPENRTPDNIALAKISLIDISVLDLGDQGPAIAAILSRMQHDEELMFAGYLRSPRTGMESQNGSRADSQQHTDTDTTDLELLDAQIARAFNRQVVDDVLVINFGEKARGAVWAEPAKMRDEHRETDYKILDAILADPMLRPAYIAQLDNDAITERRGIPKAAGKMIVLEDILPPIPPLRGQLPNDPNNPAPPDPNAQAQQ
jgi:hypothetical protein